MAKTDESYLDNLLNTVVTSNPTPVTIKNKTDETIQRADKYEQKSIKKKSEIIDQNTKNNLWESITINQETGENNTIESNEIPKDLKNELKELKEELIKELKTEFKKEIEEELRKESLLNQSKLTNNELLFPEEDDVLFSKDDDILFSEEDLKFDNKIIENINDTFDNRNNEDDINIKSDYSIFNEDDSFIDNLLNDDASIDSFLNNTNIGSSSDDDIDNLSNDAYVDDLLNEDSKMADDLLSDFLNEEAESVKEEIVASSENVYEDRLEDNNLAEHLEPLKTILQEEDKEEIKNDFNQNQETSGKSEGEFDDKIPDLLGDLFQNINEEEPNQTKQIKEDEGILQLSNSDTKKEEDILSINDFMDEIGAFKEELDPYESMDDLDLSNLIPDIEERELGTKKSDKKKNQEESGENKKKSNIFKRIFGNLPDKRSEEEIEKLKEKVISLYNQKEQSELDKKDKKIADKKLKEELKKQQAEDAKAKKIEADKEKAEKAKLAKEKKQAKKDAKLKKQQEIQNLIDQIDDTVGRINKIGASIIFIIFIMIATTIIIGTNTMTYNKSIEDAKSYFGRDLYNEAMDSVYGLEIKEEDMEFYDQVLTVMYVNQQYNAYDNFCKLEMYPQALHSLLKGLVYYDKFYSNALSLGIESDLDKVRETILAELETNFDITEQEATRIINYNDKVEYSDTVYYYADLAKGNFAKKTASE